MAWTAVAVVLLTLVVVLGALAAGRSQRQCPRCKGPTREFELPEALHAEGRWCDACHAPSILAFGRRGAPARCPQCHQRALALRATNDDGSWWIEAACGLCHHTDGHPIHAEEPSAIEAASGRGAPRGIVVPFPSPNDAARRRAKNVLRSGPHCG